MINATAGPWTKGMGSMEVDMSWSAWVSRKERELMLELRPERVYGYAREGEVKNGFCCQQQSLPWLFSPSVLVGLILCLFFRTFWYVYVLYQPSKQNPKHALLSCSYSFHMLCCSPGKPSSLLNSLISTLPIRWSVLSTFHDFYSSKFVV